MLLKQLVLLLAEELLLLHPASNNLIGTQLKVSIVLGLLRANMVVASVAMHSTGYKDGSTILFKLAVPN